MPFDNLGLRPEIMRAIEAQGFNEPTPIQERALPIALTGKDLLGCAQTGSGKTMAFVLPMIQHLLKNPKPGVRMLVVVPTRELAVQVEKAFSTCARFTDIKSAVIIGGVGYGPQDKALDRKYPVLVATPGRLLDHCERGTLKLSGIEILVLDEADRMLDMGFMPDIRRIINKLPRKRQTMFFSATLVPEILKVASFALHDPERIEISPPATVAEGISQIVYPVAQMQKSEFLIALLKSTEVKSVLIFTRTRHGAERLSNRLKNQGMRIGVLHADKTQGQRTAAMEDFRAGKIQILVATDIASRGIDVKDISHVINYDVPQHPEDYVHRVGRTARAYGVGDAITLMDQNEQSHLSAIERFLGIIFPRAQLPNFDYKIAPLLKAPKPRTMVDVFARRRRSFTRRIKR